MLSNFECCLIYNTSYSGSCLFYLGNFYYSITKITPQGLQQNAINFCLNEYSQLYWIGSSHYKFENGMLQKNAFAGCGSPLKLQSPSILS